jgi:hypothetical protein
MKKIFALLSIFVLIATPVMAIDTGLTRDTTGGQTPIVKVKWEANTDKYTDDKPTAGAQFLPSGVKDVNKTISLCAIVTDPDGLADITTAPGAVYGDVFYPENIALGDSHKPLTGQSGDGCGKLMQEDKLVKLSKADGIELFCNKVKNLNNNLPIFNTGYTYDEICALDGELQKETAGVFCATKDLSYEDPSGEYAVWAVAQDKVGLQGKLVNSFTYLPVTAFETDFDKIDYGPVKLATHKIISGDLTWNAMNAGGASVRNVGNTRLSMKVWQSDMGFGKTDGIWNVKYDARVGSTAAFKNYWPEETKKLVDPLDLSQLDEMDFSIDIAKFPPTHEGDSYTGTMTLSAVSEAHLICTPPTTFCGNNIVDPGETCELPNTTNNILCPQSTSRCLGNKLQTRDASGNCNGTCGCVEDNWSNPVCVKGTCEAGCAVDADCNDSNPGTTDTCNLETCGCEHSQDTGTITIHKVVVNNEIGTKSAGDFQMTIDGNNAAQDTPITVGVGLHTVSEVDSFGYVKTVNVDCAANGTVIVAKGDAKNCTVTNTYPFFTVTVNKILVNNNGGNAVTGDFNLFVGPYAVTSGISKKVPVGTYLISESGVIGYTAVFSGDCDPSTQMLTGANGDTKTCTITNDDIAPVITLVKSVVGGSALPTDFIMRIDGGAPVPTGSSKSVTSNAAHTINEDAKAGYHFTSMTGTGSQGSTCPATLGGTVTLNEGEVITCTITNTAD